MEKAAEEQPAPLEVPQCDSGCPPRRAFVPCLSQSKRLQAAQQDPLEERAQIYAWCASARRSAPNPRAPSPRYPLEVGPWLLLSLDFHQGLRLLASPTQQGAPVPLSPGAGWGSLEASQSARPARLARPHGGFTGALGLVWSPPWTPSVAWPFHPVTHVGEHRLIKAPLSADTLAPGPWPPAQGAGPHGHFTALPRLGDAAQGDGIPRGSLGHWARAIFRRWFSTVASPGA